LRKKFDDIFNRLDTTYEHVGPTDGETDRQRPTAKTAPTHSVAQ